MAAPPLTALLIDHRRRPRELVAPVRQVTVRCSPTARVRGRPAAWSPPDRQDIVDCVIALDRLAVLVAESVLSQEERRMAWLSTWEFLSRAPEARDALGYDRLTFRLAQVRDLALDRHHESAGRPAGSDDDAAPGPGGL